MVRKSFKYGKSTTQVVFEAVQDLVSQFGRPVSRAEISKRVESKVRGFKLSNVGADLSVLTVNDWSRGNYSVNKKPRKTDSRQDKLFRTGARLDVRYSLYDPALHGIWELAPWRGSKVLRPRFWRTLDGTEIDRVRETDVAFLDNITDGRKRALMEMCLREGQPAFRKKLLTAYARRCAVSGCTIPELLEAAHIVPYNGTPTNELRNGILLRADLHKLFDLHFFGIDPTTRTVHLSSELLSSEYALFEGKKIYEPAESTMRPHAKALSYHYARCSWANAGPKGEPLDVAADNTG